MNKMIFIPMLLFMLLIIAYVFIRGIQVLSFQPPIIRIIYSVIFLTMMVSFLFRMFKGDTGNLTLSYILGVIGFTWFILIIYFALISVSVDLIRVVIYIFKIYPVQIKELLPIIKSVILVASVSIVTLLLIVGNYNFNHPVVTKLNLNANSSSKGKELNIVMVSDVHLSSYIGLKDLKRYVKMINEQNPDIVLFAGDIVDRNFEPLVKLNLGEEINKIKSKYGIYAISGNHEFYGGNKSEIFEYLAKYGVTLLTDSIALVADDIYIIGREDKTNRHRKNLDSLLSKAHKNLPKILLDHQPYSLHDSQNKVDLHLSGHTHKGQFWPVTKLVKYMYELDYGYLKKGNTHYYVSSGLGIWGPKVRLGSKSELVMINFKY